RWTLRTSRSATVSVLDRRGLRRVPAQNSATTIVTSPSRARRRHRRDPGGRGRERPPQPHVDPERRGGRPDPPMSIGVPGRGWAPRGTSRLRPDPAPRPPSPPAGPRPGPWQAMPARRRAGRLRFPSPQPRRSSARSPSRPPGTQPPPAHPSPNRTTPSRRTPAPARRRPWQTPTAPGVAKTRIGAPRPPLRGTGWSGRRRDDGPPGPARSRARRTPTGRTGREREAPAFADRPPSPAPRRAIPVPSPVAQVFAARDRADETSGAGPLYPRVGIDRGLDLPPARDLGSDTRGGGERVEPPHRLLRRVGGHRGHRAAMAGLERGDQSERLGTPDLARDETIRTETESRPDQLTDGDLTHPFCIGGTCLETDDVTGQ